MAEVDIYAVILLGAILNGLFWGTVAVYFWPKRFIKHSPAAKEDVSVQVLVLGDIGRSPRMQYHALSIARHGGRVDLIGYLETRPHPDIANYKKIKIHSLSPPPSQLKSIPFIIAGPLKVLWQIYTLINVLIYKTEPARWLLVQNPPTIPTLGVAMVTAVMRNTHLMIDWHNYGWTILAGVRGDNHPFVSVARKYECYLGRKAATANITVTHAMARQLKEAPYYIRSPILTLHDRPASIFKPVESPQSREMFLRGLRETKDFASSITNGSTKLIVSSTSWTPDEDFSLLMNALVEYAASGSAVPVLAIITGRGPQKAHFEAVMAELQETGKLPNVTIKTAFLILDDYARLLACADLGVCLHMSSSGVDLPMKVVDMFGAGLPVVAYSAYESFGELVKEGENGCGFETAGELAIAFERLFGSNKGAEELQRLRQGAVKEGSLRWDEEWDRVLGRTFGLIDAS